MHGRDAGPMTREHKLALILGFALVLVVGVLLSDHLSGARQATLEEVVDDSTVAEGPLVAPGRPIPEPRSRPDDEIFATNQRRDARIEPAPEPHPGPPPSRIVTGTPIDETGAVAGAEQPRGPSLSVDELRRYAREQFGVELTPVTPAVGLANGASPDRTREARDAPAPRLHTVREGETLWSIAQRHYGDGSLHARLAAYNRSRMPDPNALRVGLTLLIPAREALLAGDERALASRGANATPAADPPAASTSPERRSRTYTVERGDTLGEISMALLGTSKRWREIYELNKDRIDDPNNVLVGTTLRIPPK